MLLSDETAMLVEKALEPPDDSYGDVPIDERLICVYVCFNDENKEDEDEANVDVDPEE